MYIKEKIYMPNKLIKKCLPGEPHVRQNKELNKTHVDIHIFPIKPFNLDSSIL